MSDAAATSANPSTPDISTDQTQQGQPESGKQPTEADKEPWRKVKHKYKAAGQEREVDYDELIKRAEKADGADEKFRRAAEIEKQAKARFEKLKDPSNEDWDDLVELIGYDRAKKFADKLVWDEIQWNELSEEKRDALQAQKRATKAESELQKLKQDKADAEKQAMQQQANRIIEKEIADVIAQAKKEGLPVADLPEIEEYIVDDMIAYLEWMDVEEAAGRKIQTPPPSHEDVLRKIQERFNQRSDVYVKRLSVEQLTKVLTKEQLEGLRQAEIDQLYAPIPKPSQAGPKQSESPDPFERRQTSPKKQDRRMRTEDFFAKLDQSFGG